MSKNIEMQVLVGNQYETVHPVPAEHASSHATGSSDPITPESIGAQDKLSGEQGQVVGFDSSGNAIAIKGPLSVIEQNKGEYQKFWRGTQEEYDAIIKKDSSTMYIVTDASGDIVPAGDMFKEIYDKEDRSTDIFKYVDEGLDTKVSTSEKGSANGVATLGDNGKVPDTQLPNYAPSTHASQHSSTGTDPITPASIGASESGHTHDDRYYTESEVNTLLSGKSDTSHNHDDRYYTETEVNNLLNNKQNASTAINTSNIGSQSVNYANSAGSANSATNAGNADTVDDCHVNLDPASVGIKLIYAGTGELTSGSSGLTTGYIYLQYE